MMQTSTRARAYAWCAADEARDNEHKSFFYWWTEFLSCLSKKDKHLESSDVMYLCRGFHKLAEMSLHRGLSAAEVYEELS